MRSSVIRPHGTEVACETYLYDMVCDSCSDKVRTLIWVGTASMEHTVAFCLRCAKDIERDINESIGSAISPHKVA
jgi:copper chaperone CopZ